MKHRPSIADRCEWVGARPRRNTRTCAATASAEQRVCRVRHDRATFHDLVAGPQKERVDGKPCVLPTRRRAGGSVKAARAAELQIEDVEVRAQLCFALRPFDDLDMSSPARAGRRSARPVWPKHRPSAGLAA